MKRFLALLLLGSLNAFAAPVVKYVSVDKPTWDLVRKDLKKFKVKSKTDETVILPLTFQQIDQLSHKIHTQLKRCGGFMTYDTLDEAKDTGPKRKNFLTSPVFVDYSIDQQATVTGLLANLSEVEIRTTIERLSSFNTRHYLSESGKQSSLSIMETWQKMTLGRSDIKVELFQHKQWAQPSVILTITGSEAPEEIVVVGAHADSIAMDGDHAPGADDNASGIATITEALRLLVLGDHRPKRTIQFMAFAAEEAGLMGSREVANAYKQQLNKVAGMIQFDMTLFKGTPDKDILLISDYTNKAQNLFVSQLIDEYVKVPWGYSRCGYACSDHAAWSAMGFASSFPFESNLADHNPAIHTANDTLDAEGASIEQVVKFTKLATAYIIELAN